jgi:hypothetical protein
MSLDDIADLVAAWPTGECRSLQARLRAFLGGRIGQVHAQLTELWAFEGQLRAVLDRLSARDPGPERCGKGCICETDLDLAPIGATAGPGSWGCSLGSDALASRIGQWRALAAAATSVKRASDTVRLVLPAGPEMIAAVAALCASETACCAQTRFGLEITANEVTLTAKASDTPDLLNVLLADTPSLQ